jgi:hypothetical protein
MNQDHETPIHSPLAQSVTRGGKTVQVDIYEDGEDGWLLEVIDEYRNSTVWDAPFASDHEALAEAFKTIDEDGIESLIGAPPGRLSRQLPMRGAPNFSWCGNPFIVIRTPNSRGRLSVKRKASLAFNKRTQDNGRKQPVNKPRRQSSQLPWS